MAPAPSMPPPQPQEAFAEETGKAAVAEEEEEDERMPYRENTDVVAERREARSPVELDELPGGEEEEEEEPPSNALAQSLPTPSALQQLTTNIDQQIQQSPMGYHTRQPAPPPQPAPPQRVPSPKYVADALYAGDTTYGRRQRGGGGGGRKPQPAGVHSGFDELGFSTAWRSQPR